MSEPIVKVVSAPLTVDQMKEAFLNKADRDSGKVKYVVDYAKSSIKGDVLLQYLSNLEINADFDFSGASKQDRFDFLWTYMKMKTIIKNRDLNYAAASVLLHSKGYEPSVVKGQAFLSPEEVKEFYATHTQLVARWAHIVDSSLLLLVRATAPQASLDEYESITDPSYGCVNFVNLYEIPNFFLTFTELPSAQPLVWFTHQFEEFAFNNELLLRIMMESDKSIFSSWILMDIAAYGKVPKEQLEEVNKALEKVEAALNVRPE
jgi:hypothetical protein